MTDEQILDLHNRCIEAQQALAEYFDWVAEAYSLQDFGEVLSAYAGWGMRVTFVPDIELRKPKKGR